MSKKKKSSKGSSSTTAKVVNSNTDTTTDSQSITVTQPSISPAMQPSISPESPQSSPSSYQSSNGVDVMALLKQANDQIELTILEKDTYDSISRNILDLKKIEIDISTKLKLIEDSSTTEKEEDDLLGDKIKTINSKLNEFKETTQQLDLKYVEIEEDVVTLFNEVNMTSDLEGNILILIVIYCKYNITIRIFGKRYNEA